MRFELAEIEARRPTPAEEAELEAERERLRHAEALRAAAAGALAALDGADEDGGGARSALGGAESGLAGVDGRRRRARRASPSACAPPALELDELAGDLRGYVDGIEAEPGRLEAVEERLDALDRLKRKHGGSIEAVLAHAEHCRAEIERLENAEERAGELEARTRRRREASAPTLAGSSAPAGARRPPQLERARRGRARRAGDGGRDAGGRASSRIRTASARSGAETVELLVATNPGMPTSPLRDAASGGELSRIMLALAGPRRARAASATLVFDEIDAGHRRQHRAGGRRAAAATSRAEPPGALHHPPAAGRLAAPRRTSGSRRDVERRRRRGDGRAGRRRRAGRRDRADARRRRGRRGGQPHARELLEAA